ncbi:LmeA family phospholipid-binding protein [Aquipuribacter sp. SD81]|uniref:LmeA family phospholipid-binding protein n=1 Tax=Aquipuribacter sp. SD81 TaxID=3127703 RepID=UPI0030159E9F
MASQRTRDRLTGALLGVLVTLLVLAVAGAALFLVVTEPADGPGTAAPSPTPGSPPDAGAPAPEPPADLGPEESWLGDVDLDSGALVLPGSRLRDVTATGSGVRSGPETTTAQSLAVVATVPFEVVAEQIGPGVVVSAAADGQAQVETTVEALGRELDVVATGRVAAVDGRLAVTPTEIDVGGPSFLDPFLGDVAAALTTIEQDIEGIPEGLVLREVTVVDDGFRAELDGTDVVLVP